MANSIFELIYQKYYAVILRYCRVRLHGDLQGAEDCTQEVFLILHKKLKRLTELESILPWLYRTADREIKAYLRKHPITVDLDDIQEPSTSGETNHVLDELESEERQILELYYSGVDKQKLAQSMGISTVALYQKVYRIREKLRRILEEFHR